MSRVWVVNASRAKRRGVIETARPVIEHLRKVGLYASDSLIEQVLKHVGE
jgi:predicted nucleic acid-binding protein